MNKLPFFLALFVIILTSLACGASGTSTAEPTEPGPATDLPAPSNTPEVPNPTPKPPTNVPTATLQPSATPEEAVDTLELGNDRFRLTDPLMEDERIGQMKFRLMDLGYVYGPDTCMIVSSFYTYATNAAVLLFQETNGLEVDGIVGPITWGTLFSVDAIPAQAPDVPIVEAEPRQIVLYGKAFALTGKQIWIMENSGMFTTFTLDGEFDGFYLVEPLPGEEMYEPMALWFDGAYFWIAQQGFGDAIVQAYDPNKTNPVEGMLPPVYEQSIHFPASQVFTAAASDGKTLWLIIEDYLEGNILLQPIDLASRTAGEPFRIGKSSGYPFGYSLAYDADSKTLWMTYGDELFGEGAVLEIDPVSREIRGALPFCGQQLAYDGELLWIASSNELFALNPVNDKLIVRSSVGNWVNALFVRGDEVWTLTYEGSLYVTGKK